MSIAELDHRHLWHPFTQMSDWLADEPLVVVSGEGNWLVDERGRRFLDGVSSLWCNVHGHRHPAIDAAVVEQLGRIAHTTMLGLTHPGAAELAARLVGIVPEGLTRVFYSDAGATAVEIALALRPKRSAPPPSNAGPSAGAASSVRTTSTAPPTMLPDW